MRRSGLVLAAAVMTAAAGLLATAGPSAAAAPPAAGRVQGVYGPYVLYEACWVAGNNGQQAGQWQSFFCSQNGTDQWWLFTTP